MQRLNRWERPMLYGMSGSSKWLLDASMVIWNLVGLLALAGMALWLRERWPAAQAGRVGSPMGRGRKSRLAMPSQMAHARAVTGERTNEDFLAEELARSSTPHGPSAEPPTSEEILQAELARTQGHAG